MTVEIISWSISTKVWYRAGIELATPGSAVRHASVARHVTDCATRPGELSMIISGQVVTVKEMTAYLAIAEHSICQPGRPSPQGDSQKGSPGFLAFHRAKSWLLLFTVSNIIVQHSLSYGLPTTQAQTSLPILTAWSEPLLFVNRKAS